MRSASSAERPRRGRTGRGGVHPRILVAALLAALPLAALTPLPAAAQAGDGIVAGTVVAQTTSLPVPDAQVLISGTRLGSVTGADGRFRITGVVGESVVLQVRRLGYRPETVTARVGQTDVRIQLQERSVELEQVVVTGTAGATQRREVGNAISTIDAAQVTAASQINNLQELINGRAPGVVIQPASGAIGTGARIRIRGLSSLSLGNEPLIYIDGVRVNNAPATGPANQGFGSSSVSRVNDLNTEDIESIEIIKGPAAATLYGTEASNGVIQIITRKGAAGAPRWNFTMKQGANWLANPEDVFPTNYQIVNGEVVALNIIESERAAGRDIFHTGHMQEYDLSVTGGSERVRYYAAGGYQSSEGAEPSNSLTRWSGQMNLDVEARDNLSLGLNASYVSGPTNLSAEAGFGGRVWTVVLADPRKLETRRGFHSGLPEEYDLLYNFVAGVNRLTTGVRAQHQPFSWLTHRFNAGIDRTSENNEIFLPYAVGQVDVSVFGSEAEGYKWVQDKRVDVTTLDYNASATFQPMSALRSTTSFGGQYFHNELAFVNAEGSIVPAPGLTSIEATVGPRSTTEDFVEDVTVGFYLQQQLGWRDRLFLTAAVRTDDNSAFGRNFDRVYYPKASLSWVLSEEPFFTVPWTSLFRLRAAYGESGQQPQTFAAIRTYAPVTGPGDQPAVTPQFIGNPDLGPERGVEYELGFDAGFLEDRLGIEFTYYNKRTEDAILEREIAPSAGVPGRQFFNAGEIRNTGIELLVRGIPVQRQSLGWEATFNLATNDNEVVSLGSPDLTFVPLGIARHQVGFPVAGFFEQRVVSATRDATGKIPLANVLCDNGAGGTMVCAGPDLRYGTTDDAPDVFLGRSVPEVEGAFGNTITLWNRVRLYGLIDFKLGHHKMNGNTRVRCTFFGGRCRENFFPEEFPAELIAQVESNRNLVDFLIEDASFTKLRELSVSYIVPEQWAARMGASRAVVGIAGRNLYTWTDYTGVEPEAMFLGGSRGGQIAWEQTTLPQLRQFVFTVNLGF